jgi:hypothetical protein
MNMRLMGIFSKKTEPLLMLQIHIFLSLDADEALDDTLKNSILRG